jgi:cytidine deaminase
VAPKVDPSALIEAAAKARARAYAPYSQYPVGAVVLGASGKVYAGCNVENASYGLSVCAERVAIFRAVAEGETEIVALAVVTEDGAAPCGACRQVLHEFGAKARVLIGEDAGGFREVTLAELLPDAFEAQ